MTTDLRDQLQQSLGATYRFERELGGGGMSRVFLFEDSRLGRRVVVKVLHPDLAASLSAARFEREVRLAARLQHPHVVPLLNAGELDGLPFYTMPYVDGESLRQRLLREGAFPLADAIRLVRELADALAYAHAQGVVHRDLKPENVLLSAGHAVVADFGVAKALSASTQGGGIGASGASPHTATTGLGIAVGTPAYMAPEQAAGDPETDHRADLYALGIIAYEVITGAHPFAGRSLASMIAAHLAETPAPLVQQRAEVPPALAALVMAMLAKSPSDRPQRADEVVRTFEKEFASELERSASREAVAAGPRRWRTRSPQVLLVGILLVLVAAATSAVLSGRPTAETPIRSLAVLPFRSSSDSMPPHLIDGIHDEIIAELGRQPTVRVIGRTSVLQFRETSKTISEIARDLDVDAVVEGAFHWMGDSVQLRIRLVRAVPEERQLWSRPFDTDVRHIMALRSEVARGIVEQLNTALASPDRGAPADPLRVTAPKSASQSAAELQYLEGRYHLLNRRQDGLKKSLAALRNSIKLDSAYAPAHAAMAEALAMAVDWHHDKVDPIVESSAALAEAKRAIELDSLNAEAFAARGRVLSAAHAPAPMVRAAFERALQLKPQYGDALGWFGMELAWRELRDESRRMNEMAVAKEPYAPGRRMGFAISALNYGSPEEALREAQHAMRMEPDLLHPRSAAAIALLLLNRANECVALALGRYLAIRALCQHTRGEHDAAKRLIDSLGAVASAASRPGGPYEELVLGENLALYYAWTGDVDATLKWMERAADITTAATPFLYLNSTIFDEVKRDPRFRAGVEKLKADIWRKVSAASSDAQGRRAGSSSRE